MDKLLSSGYDVPMLRDIEDVQLDNVARLFCNNVADSFAPHWDSGDGQKLRTKGMLLISVPEAFENLEPVASHWRSTIPETDLEEGLPGAGELRHFMGKGHEWY